ncbi:MAG: Nif3-like dinuclear metal center hexameric protein [Rikenellaceae bacterium]|nr:Nif3-like dinuclear metal center hexameric protein [Rikenellaceae bacterium]
MKAGDIIDVLESVAPPAIQESWDNSGLSVGDVATQIKSVILALDCTEEVIDEALESGANMIITHHPLIFRGVKKISPETNTGRMLIRAIKEDIVMYSLHTNMDKVISGVSGKMAQKLGLEDLSFLRPDPSGETGTGLVGNLPKPISYSELVAKVKSAFNVQSIKSSFPPVDNVTRIALCGGSGASFAEDAFNSGAQVYITGDITYHLFFTEKGFSIMDIGHYESEVGVLEVIKDILLKKMPTFVVRIAAKNNNPIHYF